MEIYSLTAALIVYPNLFYFTRGETQRTHKKTFAVGVIALGLASGFLLVYAFTDICVCAYNHSYGFTLLGSDYQIASALTRLFYSSADGVSGGARGSLASHFERICPE